MCTIRFVIKISFDRIFVSQTRNIQLHLAKRFKFDKIQARWQGIGNWGSKLGKFWSFMSVSLTIYIAMTRLLTVYYFPDIWAIRIFILLHLWNLFNKRLHNEVTNENNIKIKYNLKNKTINASL